MTFYETKIINYIHWNSKDNNGVSILSIRNWFRRKFSNINDKEFNEIMNKMIEKHILKFPQSNIVGVEIKEITDDNGKTIKKYSKDEREENMLNGNVMLSSKAIEYFDETHNSFVRSIKNSGLRYIISIILSHLLAILLLMP